MIPAYKLKMNTPIQAGVVAVGKFDGRHPSLAAGTSGGKVLLSGVSAPQMASIQHTGQTTNRGQIINSEYTPEEHEWNHCLTTQMAMVQTKDGPAVTGHRKDGSTESYAGFISDGSAKSKLASLEKEELLHPIGSVMDANGE